MMETSPLADHVAGVSTLTEMVLRAPPSAIRLLLRSLHHPPQVAVLPALQRWIRASSGQVPWKQRQQALEVIQMLHETGVDFNACLPGGQTVVARLRQSGFPEEALDAITAVSPGRKAPHL